MVMEEFIKDVSHHLALIIEGLALLVIAGGLILALANALIQRVRRGDWKGSYDGMRQGIGRTLLIGLEFLLAGEIARSIFAGETLDAALTLAIVVVVRTFLSFAIDMEINGCWPWHAAEAMSKGEVSE